MLESIDNVRKTAAPFIRDISVPHLPLNVHISTLE